MLSQFRYRNDFFKPTILCLLMIAATAIFFDQRVDAQVTASPHYTFRDGFWWNDGQAFTREKQFFTRQGKPYYRWKYTPRASSDLQSIQASDADWRGKLLEFAKQRDAYAANQQTAALEQQYFLEGLQALGVGPFSLQGQGFAQSAAYGGDSLYGYSSMADLYHQADRGLLLNQYQNTTNRTLDLADKASSNLKSLYSEELSTQGRVAEIIAQRDQAVAALKATAEVIEATKTNSATSKGAPSRHSLRNSSSENILQTKCATCHSASQSSGSIALDGSQKLSIRQAIKAASAVQVGMGLIQQDLAEVAPMPPIDSGIEVSRDEYRQMLLALQQLMQEPN